MGSIFKGPPKPKLPKTIVSNVPEAPSRASDAVQEAARTATRRGRGRSSTILTDLAAQLQAGDVVRKRLLGGS